MSIAILRTGHFESRPLPIFATALGWGLLAFLFAWVVAASTRVATGIAADSVLPVAVVIAILAGVFGGLSGARKAAFLKLEAQRTLCQLQIERNTRVSKRSES
jgi:hypothetical protein